MNPRGVTARLIGICRTLWVRLPIAVHKHQDLFVPVMATACVFVCLVLDGMAGYREANECDFVVTDTQIVE